MNIPPEDFKKYFFFLLLIVAGLGYTQPNMGWARHTPEVYATRQPIQNSSVSLSPFNHKNYRLNPKASFEIQARVLNKHRYFLGRGSRFAPIDLALGWGQMANYRIIKKLKFSQRHRWYYYKYRELPMPEKDIIAQSANMHLIAANEDVAKKIKRVKRGDVVTIKGHLVDVYSQSGQVWTTSLSRSDVGAGSCEIIWVEEFSKK